MADFVPKRKKLLTRPVFKWVVGATLHCKIETAMHIGKEIKSRNPDPDKKKEPATLCDVTIWRRVSRGRSLPTRLSSRRWTSTIRQRRTSGKCFSITKQARQEGKQYDKFQHRGNRRSNAGSLGCKAGRIRDTHECWWKEALVWSLYNKALNFEKAG